MNEYVFTPETPSIYALNKASKQGLPPQDSRNSYNEAHQSRILPH